MLLTASTTSAGDRAPTLANAAETVPRSLVSGTPASDESTRRTELTTRVRNHGAITTGLDGMWDYRGATGHLLGYARVSTSMQDP